ncbi:hypothetical protein BDB01DRAFT_806318 [Pilobolus umbonatus]|nr:hypothetical protein BDB01DRAFT_806318 [Pilobolus umbonatus]
MVIELNDESSLNQDTSDLIKSIMSKIQLSDDAIPGMYTHSYTHIHSLIQTHTHSFSLH